MYLYSDECCTKYGRGGCLLLLWESSSQDWDLNWCVTCYLWYINVFMNLLPFGTTKYGNMWWFNMIQSIWCMCLVLLIWLIWGICIGDLFICKCENGLAFSYAGRDPFLPTYRLRFGSRLTPNKTWRATWGKGRSSCRLRLPLSAIGYPTSSLNLEFQLALKFGGLLGSSNFS